MATFIVHTGKLKGQRINLGPGQFLMGRDVRCPICIPSEDVSRMHCEFEIGTTTIGLRDVGSRNGTIVNGDKIETKVQLKPGDVLDIGPMKLEVESTSQFKRPGSVAPHVADESLVADSIVDWLQQDNHTHNPMAETTSFPSLMAQDTPSKKFADVAEEGADIIRRHLEAQDEKSD